MISINLLVLFSSRNITINVTCNRLMTISKKHFQEYHPNLPRPIVYCYCVFHRLCSVTCQHRAQMNIFIWLIMALGWRHYEHDGVSNHLPRNYLLSRLLRRRSKETSTLRVTGLCLGKSPVTNEFSAQRASNAENVSIWWRHHGQRKLIRWWTSLW